MPLHTLDAYMVCAAEADAERDRRDWERTAFIAWHLRRGEKGERFPDYLKRLFRRGSGKPKKTTIEDAMKAAGDVFARLRGSMPEEPGDR